MTEKEWNSSFKNDSTGANIEITFQFLISIEKMTQKDRESFINTIQIGEPYESVIDKYIEVINKEGVGIEL